MKISVVIPAYNEKECLKACLQSLAAQTKSPYEVIVVDNNSTDSTVSVARQFGAKVLHEKAQGIMPAAFTGFNACTGDIIARCDADSILPADWLEKIDRQFAARPNAAAVTGPGHFYGTHTLAKYTAQVWYMYAYFALVGLALSRWPLFGSNCALRRTVWLEIQQDVHRNRMDIHDDIDISMHLRPEHQVIFNPSLRVAISARSLRASGLASRYAKGFRSLYIHWPEQAPWIRWYRRLVATR